MSSGNNSGRPWMALFGEWDTTNLGDTAIGISATRLLLKAGYRIKVFSYGSFAYLGPITNLAEVDSVFHAFRPSGNNKYPLTLQYPIKILSSMRLLKCVARVLRNQSRSKVIKHELSNCSGIFVGGGELLNFEYDQFFLSNYLIGGFVRRLRIPLYCVGCGSGFYYSIIGKYWIRKFVSLCDVFLVRDHRTQHILQQLTIHSIGLCGDLALQSTPHHENQKPNCIAINVKLEPEVSSQYLACISDIVSILCNTDLQVRIILFTTGNEEDCRVAEEIKFNASAWHNRIALVHPSTLSDLKAIFDQAQVVLASRLHAAILSWNCGVPALGICHSGKLKNFYGTVNLGNQCYDVLDSSTSGLVSNQLLNRKLPIPDRLNVVEFAIP